MQIYYYTRTQRSENIAHALGKAHALPVHQITDSANWSGAHGFLKGGAAACRKQSGDASYTPVAQGEEIILVFPVWAGTYPPAVRSFLQQNTGAHIIAAATSLGTTLKDRDAFAAVIDLIGKEITMPDITAYL